MNKKERLVGLCQLLQSSPSQVLCVDIETTHYDGEIAVLGAHSPAYQTNQVRHLIHGESLNRANLQVLFSDVKLILTYNGANHDVPKIEKEFPKSIAHIKHLDVYELAQELGLQKGLKDLEAHFGLGRPGERQPEKRYKAISWWKSYKQGSHKHRQALLDYNFYDCVNLYKVAKILAKKLHRMWVYERVMSFDP